MSIHTTTAEKSNIILIGMPGSGKSTVGVQLAKHCAMEFMDTDLLIQTQQHRPLQDILDADGYLALRAIEEKVLLTVNVENTVIATGGSAVYSAKAMANLRRTGIVVFLDVALSELEQRVNNEGSRGIARPEGQTFTEVFNERQPLYQQHMDMTYNNNTATDITLLIQAIEQYRHQ